MDGGYRSRKFILTVGVLVLGTSLIVFDILELEEFKAWGVMVASTLGVYYAGNVGAKYSQGSPQSPPKKRRQTPEEYMAERDAERK
jgi:hypothetical protein